MASETAAASPACDQSNVEFDKFHIQFDDQYKADFVKGHKIWIGNELIPEISSTFTKCEKYRILSVGTGSGCADMVLLELLTAFVKENASLEKKKIKYTVVEPDAKAVALCKQNLHPFHKDLDIEFIYEIVPSEKYLLELEAKFELIHFVHAISWVKNPPEILQKCYENLLNAGGTLAIVDFDPAFDEDDDFQCVKVDEIAAEKKWNCRKFPNTIMQDFTEIYKKTEKGKQQIATFFGWDAEQLKEKEKEIEDAATHFCSEVQKEMVDGEEKYLSAVRETIYFLTK